MSASVSARANCMLFIASAYQRFYVGTMSAYRNQHFREAPLNALYISKHGKLILRPKRSLYVLLLLFIDSSQ